MNNQKYIYYRAGFDKGYLTSCYRCPTDHPGYIEGYDGVANKWYLSTLQFSDLEDLQTISEEDILLELL